MMAMTSPKAELQVFATVIGIVYEAGRKATSDFKADLPTIFGDLMPSQNYLA